MKKSNLCRCCLSGGCQKDLFSNYNHVGKLENYGAMLTKTFNIALNSSTKFICESCITRLREATTFRQQILDSEEILTEQSRRITDIENNLVSDIKSDDAEISLCDNSESWEHRVEDDAEIKLEPKGDSTLMEGRLDAVKTEVDSDDEPLAPKTTETPKEFVKQRSKKIADVKSVPTKRRHARVNKSQSHLDLLRNTMKLIIHSNMCLFKSLKIKFKCYLCKEKYLDIKDLREHATTHPVEAFVDKINRLKGMTYENVDITNLMCKLCKESCVDVDFLKKHLFDNHSVSFGDAANHLLIPYKLEYGFQCSYCTERFNTFTRLSIHMNNHSTNNVCENCGAAFFNRLSLRNHIRNQHSELKCRHCSLSFPRRSSLDKHLRRAHAYSNYKRHCPKCDMTFRYTYHLSEHMVEKHGAKQMEKVACQFCRRLFKNDGAVKVHVRSVHLKERRYQCSFCDVRCFTSTDKVRHERTHQDLKLFACNLCETKFKTKDSLRRHLKKQHAQVAT